jgi:hypothetical protein
MRVQLEVMREVLEEWMRIYEIDNDFWFYTPTEWTVKEGPDHLLQGAELMLAFENSLVSWLNYGTGIEDELQELIEGFGYYYELGHHWNMGFYPLDDWKPLPPPSMPYREKLKDPRWQRKRLRILSRSEQKCEECGSSDNLEVHHCYYRYGREVWQYPDKALLALCRKCHELRGKVELDFRLFAQSLRTEELKTLQEMMNHCKYWFAAKPLQSLLENLKDARGDLPHGPGVSHTGVESSQQALLKADQSYRALCECISQMLKTYGHPEDRSEARTRGML